MDFERSSNVGFFFKVLEFPFSVWNPFDSFSKNQRFGDIFCSTTDCLERCLDDK